MSSLRVHSVSAGLTPGSALRVHSVAVTGGFAAASRVRIHSVSASGSVPVSTGSRIRLHGLTVAGRVAIPRPVGGRIWDPVAKTWSPLKMRLRNKGTLNWDVILGSPDSTVVNDGLDHSSPVADAGAVPLGTARYNVSATALFVSLQGSDTTGTGTVGSPYRTLAKAHASLPAAGGMICVRGGTATSPWVYEGEGSTSLNVGLNMDKQVTVQNYPGEAVIYDGSQVLTGWTTDTATSWKAPYTQVTDRSPTFTRGAADSTVANFGFINPTYPCAAWPDQVWVDGVVQTQVDTKAKVTAGTFYVEGSQSGMIFTPTTLYLGSNPAGHEIRATRMNKHIRLAGAGSVLRGFMIRRYSPTLCDFGMVSQVAQDSLVENMHFVDSASIGISMASRSGMTQRSCTVWNSGALGIHVNNADAHVVEKVNVQYSNRERWNYAPVSGHIKITRSQGSIVRNSILSNGHCKAYWDDETVDQAWIYSCLIENNEHRALVHELSSRAITLNNKIIGSTLGGILIFNSDLSRTWNNTVIDTGGLSLSRMVGVYQDDRNALDGVTTGRDTRQPDSYYTDFPEHQWKINSYEMCNNVVALPRTSNPQSMFGFERLSPTGTYNAPGRTFAQYGPTQDGNFWNNINTVLSKPWIVPNGTNAATVYQTLAAFAAATGQDANGTYVAGTRAVNADGSMVAAYRDAANAKARPLPADLAALIGQPAGAKWVGCFW